MHREYILVKFPFLKIFQIYENDFQRYIYDKLIFTVSYD